MRLPVFCRPARRRALLPLGRAGEPGEQIGECLQLPLAEAIAEELLDRRKVRARSFLQLRAARVGQHGVRHSAVGGTLLPADETRGFEALEEPRHPGGRELQVLHEVGAAETLIVGVSQHEEGLVVVDRQAVVAK